jgi:teichuronic acid biosynthesis glycosyltransferase TuaC
MEMINLIANSQENLYNKTLLIITPSYPNEDESFIVDIFVKCQVAELKKYFKKVIVIAPVLRSFKYLKKDRLCKDYIYDNVEVYYPRCIYIPIFWMSKFLIDNRLEVVKRTIEEHHLHFNLIHAHFTWPSGYIGVRLKEKYGKPVIITIHEDGDWFDHEVGMKHPLIIAAWTNANALIRVNRKDVPVMQHYNKFVYAIPNGFSQAFHPIDKTIARKRLGLPEDTKIIFSLGNLIKRKGFNYVIDVMEQICIHRDDVLCFIGGTGPEKGGLEREIDRLHLGKKVRLLGSVPGDQLTFWMNAIDLFVLSSLNEGNPTVMFEAMGCGKPFVGTSVGGVPEIIISDVYGLLVKPADPKDLEEKILIALDRKWDQEAILTYSAQFSWENISKEIIDVYEQILRLTSE